MFINRFMIRFGKGLYGKIIGISVFYFLHILSGTAILFFSAIFTKMLLYHKAVLGFTSINQVLILIGISLFLQFFNTVPRLTKMEKIGGEMKSNLRADILQKLFLLGPAYTVEHRTGEITSMVTFRAEWVKRYYTDYLPIALSALFNFIFIVIFLFLTDILVGFSTLLPVLAMLICPWIMEDKMSQEGEKEWKAHDRYLSEYLDSIQGIVALKSFNANKRQKEKLVDDGENYRKIIMKHLKITITEGMLMDFFARLGCTLPMVIAAIRAGYGYLPADRIIYIFYMVLAAINPLFVLINAWHVGFNGISASKKIGEFLEEKIQFPLYGQGKFHYTYKEWKDKQANNQLEIWNGKIKEEFFGDVRFEGVSFSYGEGKEEVLKNIDFTLSNRSMTALVGISGSGKSTIAKILAGFYLPTKGKVFVGEDELSEKTVEKIQSQIAAVWQQPHLFFGTIEENLKIANPNSDLKSLKKAMEEVGLGEFVNALPEQYQTFLGEEGMRFSGGERQRLAIARCYLKNVPILIFDEATSSLDRNNEQNIQENFRHLRENKTTLVIAHRLSTIKEADQILILEKGRIVERGTHEELKNSDRYQKLMIGQLEVDHGK